MTKARRAGLEDALFAGYLTLYLGAQLAWSLLLRIDYYDALETLRNARRLVGPDIGFSTNRMPMLALLHAPLQLVLDRLDASDAARLVAPHVQQFLIGAAFLAVCYRWFLRRLPRPWARLALVLLSLNRLTVHYFDFALPDVTCALFTIGFLHAVDAKRPRLAAAALCAALATRSNLLAAPLIYLAFEAGLVLVERRGVRSLTRPAAVAAAACASFVAVNALVYHSVLFTSLPSSITLVFTTLREHLDKNSRPEPFWGYADALAGSGGIMGAALFFGGCWALASRRKPRELFPLAFFAGFFLANSLVGHKESRYIYALVPVYCLLGARALMELREKASRGLSLAAVAAALALAAGNAAVEAANFRDPAYRSSVLVDFPARVRARLTPGHKVFWTGRYYWIVPHNRRFTAGDWFFYVYHVPSPASLAYFLDQPISIPRPSAPRPGDLLVEAPPDPSRYPLRDRLDLSVYDAGLKTTLLESYP